MNHTYQLEHKTSLSQASGMKCSKGHGLKLDRAQLGSRGGGAPAV